MTGKVAIVTGASRGIGKAIAASLAAVGATVVLASNDEQELDQTTQQIKQTGADALAVPVEMTDETSIANLVKVVAESLGRLDILVNNAGVPHFGAIEKTTTADWDRVMAINARGTFILCREAIGLLKKAEHAHIINMSSYMGVQSYAMHSVYSASKHAIKGLSIALADELKTTNVRVHAICPNGVDTKPCRDAFLYARKHWPKLVIFTEDDLIKTEEIAELVTYLAAHQGNAVIDELRISMKKFEPWFY